MTQNKEKKSFQSYFLIEDSNTCIKSIRNGGIAAMISAAITSIFAVIGIFTDSSDPTLKYLLDPWLLVDVFLILILGLFIFRKSRAAATIMLIYFIGGKIFLWSEVGLPNGIIMSFIFLYYYYMAMKGTYLWHSKFKLTYTTNEEK